MYSRKELYNLNEEKYQQLQKAYGSFKSRMRTLKMYNISNSQDFILSEPEDIANKFKESIAAIEEEAATLFSELDGYHSTMVSNSSWKDE